MALLQKQDYFNLGSNGWEVTDTSDNRSLNYTTAQGDDGFTVAIEVFGNEDGTIAPQVNYVATNDAQLEGVVLGDVTEIQGKKIALGGITLTTNAGQAPTMSATGSEVGEDGKVQCTCTLPSFSVSSKFHAQDFGLFTVSNGILQSSTLSITSNIATAECDGIIKAFDLVGAEVVVSGTILGYDKTTKTISTPTISVQQLAGKSGVITQKPSQTNPNGEFPQYSFEVRYILSADQD